MADVDVAPPGTTSETATNSRVFCNPTSGAESFAIDLAPDGKYYGWGAEQCNGIYTWGTLDPAAFVGGPTPTGVVPLELVPFGGVFRPSFLQEVPDAGSPIGYRFDNQDIDGPGCGTGSRSTGNLGGTCDVDLYAVDSLTPYREHLIASHFEPNRFNFTIGTAVTVFPDAPGVTTPQTSRTNEYFITTDAVYCYGPGPICPSSVSTGKAVQVGFLSFFRLSKNAQVMSSSQQGRVFIDDGATVFNLDADPTSGFFQVTNSFTTTGITQIAGGSHYACLPGGVHFEPDDTIYVDERGARATKAVSLTYAPTADVTISFSISDPARATVSPVSLTFTPTNWNIPQTITITGVDDGIAGNGAQPFVLNTAPLSSSDPNYSGRIVRSFAGITQEAAGPTITAVAPIQLQLGSQITTTVATVSDADDAAGTLTATAEPSFHSVQFGPLTNTNGTVTTTITVPCTAQQPYGAFGSNRRYVLDVADADGNTRSDVVQVATAAAGNPVISYANTTVTAGQTTIIPPATFDGSGSSIGVSPGAGFTGSITPDLLTGNLTVSNANPPGSYTVNISTTGRCNNQTTDTSFTMRVNAPPSLTPGSATVQQGSPAISATLGTVNDLETPAGSLVVTAVSVPSGLTLGTITNTSGTITAPISANCAAPTGPQTLTLQVTDADGASTNANVTVNVTVNTPPTTGTYAATTVRAGNSATVTSAPPGDNGSVTLSAAAPGFTGTISANSSTGAVTLGNAGPPGTFTVTVTATDNCGATSTATFPLTVASPPAITSAGTATFLAGSAASFTITTTGVPVAAIAKSGALPSGVTFTDNGNDTATLAGTPAPGTAGSYSLTFTASNGVLPNAVQSFTLMVDQPPSIISASTTTFVASSTASFSISAAGFPAPAITKSGTLPAGVTFTNNGNGTATLTGTPFAGSGGVYPVTFTASNGVSPNATQTFTLTVNEAPSITSAAAAALSVGSAGSFTIATTGYPIPAIAKGGTLPSGVTFTDNGNRTATLSGAPAAGTAGSYALTFAASNGVLPNAVQAFTLTVTAGPAVTSALTTAFVIGSPGSFTITTTGVPVAAIAESGVLPSGVTFVDDGNGTATLAGTPAAGTAGSYALTFTASNGVLPNAVQSFTLNVAKVNQTLNFPPLAGVPVLTTVPLSATATSSLPVAFTSLTPSVCSISGTSATTLAVGTCTIAADQPGDGTYSSAPRVTQSFTVAPDTSFSGPTATGTGIATASFAGGGANCTYTMARYLAMPPATVPAPTGAYIFPQGLFDFTASGCTAGSTLNFTIVYPTPIPPFAQFWKYGATPSDATPHWYVLPATINGNTVTFSITDGGLGDDDLIANGSIVDQGGPAFPASAIPALDPRALAALAVMLAVVAVISLRRA